LNIKAKKCKATLSGCHASCVTFVQMAESTFKLVSIPSTVFIEANFILRKAAIDEFEIFKKTLRMF